MCKVLGEAINTRTNFNEKILRLISFQSNVEKRNNVLSHRNHNVTIALFSTSWVQSMSKDTEAFFNIRVNCHIIWKYLGNVYRHIEICPV